VFLHLSNVEPPKEDGNGGDTLTEIVDRVRIRVLDGDRSALSQLDALLLAAGYRPQDDYSSTRWIAGVRGIYRISEAFPRVVPTMLRSGISNVQYSLNIAECSPFLVSADELCFVIRKGLS